MESEIKRFLERLKKKKNPDQSKSPRMWPGTLLSTTNLTKNSHYISEERIKNYSSGIYNFKLPMI